VRDLERIGDYAKNLGEVAVRLLNYEPSPHLKRIQLMFERCRSLLALALAALSNLDAESAINLGERDDVVDSDYEMLYKLLTQQTDIPGSVEPIVLQVLAIRHLERIADHATNIGKRVTYIVTGHR
jgi:phosphate transport system protein